MTTYDPQQTPYTPPPGFTSVPQIDTERTTSGDRWGLIAITVAVMTLLSCVPGLNCIVPFAPLVAGIIALNRAKSAANPERARLFGWISTGLGILFLVGIAVIAVLYGAVIISAINQARNTPGFQTSP